MTMPIKLNKDNGFSCDIQTFLDDATAKKLYPEFISLVGRDCSELYREWKSSGLTLDVFCKNNGLTKSLYYKQIYREQLDFSNNQYEELYRRFESFVKEHKSKIFKAQCAAIEENNRLYKEYLKKKEEKENQKAEKAKAIYEANIKKYLDGKEIAILNKDFNENLINGLFRLGFELICTNDKFVFLKGANPSEDQIKKLIPFDEKKYEIKEKDDNSSKKSLYRSSVNVEGIYFGLNWTLSDYSYPVIEYEYTKPFDLFF